MITYVYANLSKYVHKILEDGRFILITPQKGGQVYIVYGF